MSQVIPTETVKIIGQSVGIDMSDDVALVLSNNVEYLFRQVLQEAKKFMTHSKRNRLTVEDVNNSLRLKNIETLYGYNSNTIQKYVKVNGAKGLFYMDNPEIDINHFLTSKPLPPYPIKVTYGIHWLAIDGIQPNIPQNAPKYKRALITSQVEEGVKEETDNIITEEVDVKPNAKHIFSKEIQMYYQKLTIILSKGTDEQIREAVTNIEKDPVMQRILQHVAKFLQQLLKDQLKDLRTLRTILSVINALLDNPDIYLDNHLHLLIPTVVTCIVSNAIGSEDSDDWSIRENASFIIEKLCNKYSNEYNTIRPRIVKILISTLINLNNTLHTHYGCIIALNNLKEDLRNIPSLPGYCTYITKMIKDNNQTKQIQAQYVYKALEMAGLIQ